MSDIIEKDIELEIPKVQVATEPYVGQKMAEHRTELTEIMLEVKSDMQRSNLQVILAIMGVGVAIILALFFR